MLPPWPDDSLYRYLQGPEPEPTSDDARLAALVAQRLAIDWTTRHQHIEVAVQNRVVILTGTVTRPEVRQVAGDLAWDVPGVHDVCNTLRPPGRRRHRG
ncbi:BON domain-containing protein [Micromonospora globbae]|jgi:osmotically-inducible protein OsmY|uniref:BON domain-containing protein n=1 Tax=Micromonospora globbae TaxID=1894969 RepID=A0ABZ1S8V6_9ACTN|nr:BON domain-containing protein [Micromonospora globbae]WTF84246.1 BON domain-containing protein [Micromonospora globbae]